MTDQYNDKGESELVMKFRARAQYWRTNSDKAWVSVKLGEMRAVLDALDRSTPQPNADEGDA